MQNHINKLAKELNCKLVVDLKFRQSAMMYVEFGYIEVPPVLNQIDYLINLHELGHVYHGHTQGRPPKQNEKFYFENGVLKSEAQAWEWALDNSIVKLKDNSRRFIWDTCLGSYYNNSLFSKDKKTILLNGNRHHVPFIYDRPDEYFTSIVNRIQGSLKNFNIVYEV